MISVGESRRGEPKIYSVDELTSLIKNALESSFGIVRVEGEISNFTKASSGHLYFTLKDERAQIRAVMFRGNARMIDFDARDGRLVRAFGKITVYKPRGTYQISVHRLEEAGLGNLQKAFEELKKKLAAEGFFDPAHKKKPPAFPVRLGVVTSPTGAAIRDIINVLRRRYPLVEVVLYPVLVQGDRAASQIARAIDFFNENELADVLIVGRGGGSLEDLWAFNEEITARALYRSRIPVISAVGHETDFTIADFTADVRAPTPSVAAEIAVPDSSQITRRLADSKSRIGLLIRRKLEYFASRVEALANDYRMRIPVESIHMWMQRIDESTRRIENVWMLDKRDRYSRLHVLNEKLDALDPEAILERGYSICRNKRSKKIITGSHQVVTGDSVNLVLASGKFDALVSTVIPAEKSKYPKTEKEPEKSPTDTDDPIGFEETGQTSLW